MPIIGTTSSSAPRRPLEPRMPLGTRPSSVTPSRGHAPTRAPGGSTGLFPQPAAPVVKPVVKPGVGRGRAASLRTQVSFRDMEALDRGWMETYGWPRLLNAALIGAALRTAGAVHAADLAFLASSLRDKANGLYDDLEERRRAFILKMEQQIANQREAGAELVECGTPSGGSRIEEVAESLLFAAKRSGRSLWCDFNSIPLVVRPTDRDPKEAIERWRRSWDPEELAALGRLAGFASNFSYKLREHASAIENRIEIADAARKPPRAPQQIYTRKENFMGPMASVRHPEEIIRAAAYYIGLAHAEDCGNRGRRLTLEQARNEALSNIDIGMDKAIPSRELETIWKHALWTLLSAGAREQFSWYDAKGNVRDPFESPAGKRIQREFLQNDRKD